jgi:hypothetical protein
MKRDNSTKNRNGSGRNPYAVKWVPIDSIYPSPENIDIYGEIQHDETMEALIDSMRNRGMEEPILTTVDGYILSGHRRHYAAGFLDWPEVPVRATRSIIGNLSNTIPSASSLWGPFYVRPCCATTTPRTPTRRSGNGVRRH